MDPFRAFLKTETAAQKEISTGHKLLDKAFGIPIQSFLLIKSEPYGGATAVALDLAATLTKQNKTVVYCDVFNSIISHRLHGIDLSKLIVFNLYYYRPEDFIEAISNLKDLENPVFILDNLKFLEKDWNNSWSLDSIAERIRLIIPEATVIATQRNGRVSKLWSYVVTLDPNVNVYHDVEGDREWMGHTVTVKGPKGNSEIYIEYATGRISKAFEHAKIEIEKGKARTAKFELDGIERQGVWQFVHEYNRRLRDGI